FDEEEMEEDIRHAFAGEGPAALRLFYDGCLAEKPDDAELWYARGLLLESLGQSDEAIASLERASSQSPDLKKIKVLKPRRPAKTSSSGNSSSPWPRTSWKRRRPRSSTG